MSDVCDLHELKLAGAPITPREYLEENLVGQQIEEFYFAWS